MEITEKEYAEIENDLIRLCNTVAIPRFIKALRNAVNLGLYEERLKNLKGVKFSISDFRQEFVDWISYGNLNTNFETKALNDYPVTRQSEEWELEITDDDIPF